MDDKDEIIRLALAGWDAGQIRLKMDESMTSKRQYDIHRQFWWDWRKSKEGKWETASGSREIGTLGH
jgi:hypothetical protein